MLVNAGKTRLSSRVAPPESVTRQFSRGYLFGQPSLTDLAHARQETRKNAHYEEKHGMMTHWTAHSTPLERYTQPMYEGDHVPTRPNFRAFLLRRAEESQTLGRLLRVLDVGVGTGDQWLGLLRTGKIDFHATSLTAVGMRIDIMKYTVTCTAAGLHRKFPPDYFDLVVAHYGTHYTQKSGLENILWVAKPGGSILVTGEGNMPPIASPENFGLFYRILNSDTYKAERKEDCWFYMLRKEFRSLE